MRRRAKLIPVIDVMAGRVVRAVGGRRDEYRPIDSPFGDAADLGGIARGMRAAARSKQLYVADLDAIRGDGRVSPEVAAFVKTAGCRVWLDAGFRRFLDVEELLAVKELEATDMVVCPVIASETAWGQATLEAAVEMFDAEPVAFSIDLFAGELRADRREWGLRGPDDVVGLATAAVGIGARTLIVLDLAGVGERAGPRTIDVCRRLRTAFPRVQLVTGGGVRGRDDVRRLADAGADAVLVASALHDGTLTV